MKADTYSNYFVVLAKCGHVGRGKYIPVYFPIRASDAKQAAFIVRQRPGVKHHHSNAILSVRKVDYIEFLLFELVFKSDPYWRWARYNMDVLYRRVREEGPYHRIDRPGISYRPFAETNKIASRQFRVRRYNFIEKSVCHEIEEEYRVTI